MNIQIRAESDKDKDAVFAVNAAAFPTDAEAKLVDLLRHSASPVISLVADGNRRIVGHIMFTPVTLEPFDDLMIMGLGPMAVTPEVERQGIGSRLVEAGLQRCRDLDYGAVVVLGHPDFYPRFGFRPSSARGISSEYDVPEEAFMLLELSANYLQDHHGVVRYNPAFGAV